MDSVIYALVLVPSLRELLPNSGIAATRGNIGDYGGLLFDLFLIGWRLAFLWGPIGDKFGRVRTLMLTILWYSTFTLLSAFAVNVWQLAILRLLAGIGIGGEWAMGAPLLQKSGTSIGASPARDSCTLDTTLGSCWRHWRITALEATSAGAICLRLEDCPPACRLGSVMA